MERTILEEYYGIICPKCNQFHKVEEYCDHGHWAVCTCGHTFIALDIIVKLIGE